VKLTHRPRRLRQSPAIRDLIRETEISISKIVLPLFVTDGKNIEKANKDLPSLMTFSVDRLLKYVSSAHKDGIRFVLLFGVTEKRNAKASEAFNRNAPVMKAISEIRSKFPDMIVGTDIALDPYTDHGHDGLCKIKSSGAYEILNDETVEALAKMSAMHANLGAQVISPSDMMDGRVAGIRDALDEEGFENTIILSYTAKYASSLYGPFRDALGANLIGDKKTYQMDPANRREALRELELDIAEGADIVMVKPATWYLDIISDFKAQSSTPVAAYHVSGEAGMIELGAKAKLFERDRAILEASTSIFRAGADILVSYFAKDLARILKR
jgi:porphobilinogen synthase